MLAWPELQLADLPDAVRTALALREYVATLVPQELIVVGTTPRPNDAARERVVVAIDLDARATVTIVLYCGEVERDWWRRWCALVPATWERLPRDVREQEVERWVDRATRDDVRGQVVEIHAALAATDLTQN